MTPMIAAVLEKFLAVEAGILVSLDAEVRSDERNMGSSCNGRGGVEALWLRKKVNHFRTPRLCLCSLEKLPKPNAPP